MPRTKDPRAPTPREVELSVLDKSRRRCALCFHLKGDLSEKQGQIAHLDDNPANAKEDNLAFLCLDHHSLYDSRTKQHKGYTLDEAKAARARLHDAIEQGHHFSSLPPTTPSSSKEADRKTFNELLITLPSGGSISFIKTFHFGAGFRWGSLKDLRAFEYNCAGPEHEFLDDELETLRTELLESIDRFRSLLVMETYQVGREDSADPVFKVPQRHQMQAPKEWDQIVGRINDAADAVVRAYDTLIRQCRGEDTKRNFKHAKRLLRLCLPSCEVAETDLDRRPAKNPNDNHRLD